MRPCRKCGSIGPTWVLQEEQLVGPYCDSCFGKLTQKDIDDEVNLIKGIKKLFPKTWDKLSDEADKMHKRGIF
jgi:hypothetical protein